MSVVPFLTTAGRYVVDSQLGYSGGVVTLSCDEPKQHYELHVDKYTAARIRHEDRRPVVRLDIMKEPVVMFLTPHQPDEWFEWRCAQAGCFWARMVGNDLVMEGIA